MKKLNLRIIHTHDTEARWMNHPEFIPNKGELIVYDVDETHTYERFKIGDGVTKLQNLPFAIESYVDSILNITDGILYADGGEIKNYSTVVESV